MGFKKFFALVSGINLILAIWLVSIVLAQNNKVESAKTDYLFQHEQYRQAYQEFIVARETFNKIGTLAAKEELLAKSRIALQKRADTLDAFLSLLNEKILITPGITPEKQQQLFNQIQAFQNFYKNHKTAVEYATDLNSLQSESKSLEQRGDAYFDVAYHVMSTMVLSELAVGFLQTQQLAGNVEVWVNAQPAPEAIQLARRRGFDEVRSRLDHVGKKFEEAQTLLQQFSSEPELVYRPVGQGNYERIKTIMIESQRVLLEITSYLRELTRGVE